MAVEKQPNDRDHVNRFRVPFAWEIPAKGDKVVVTEIQVTQTTIHQEETVGDAGHAVLPAYPQIASREQMRGTSGDKGIKPVGVIFESVARKRKPRLLDETGKPYLTVKKEREVRRLIREERIKLKEEVKKAKLRKEQSQKLINLLVNFANIHESRKLARERRYIRKHEAKEAKNQAWLKKQENKEAWLRKEQEAKKTKLQIEKSIKRREAKKVKREMWLKKQPVKEARRLELENNRKANEVKRLKWLKRQKSKEVGGMNKMGERVIVVRKFIKKEKKKIVETLIAAAIIGSAIGGAYFYPRPEGNNVAVISTPKSSDATGTPTPRPTETPKSTPTLSPKSAEAVKAPNFGIRFDSNQNCQVIDRNTGKALDISEYPFETIGYQEVGVGKTEIITSIAQPGQTVIVAGYAVDFTKGVLKVFEAKDRAITVNNTITDGFARVVNNKDALIASCSYLQIAKRNGWAHGNVSLPSGWKID